MHVLYIIMCVPPFHPWGHDRYRVVEFSGESKYRKNVIVMELGPYMHFTTKALEYIVTKALPHPSTPPTLITPISLLCPKRNIFTATAVPSGSSVPRYTKALPPATKFSLSRCTMSPRFKQYREARLARSQASSCISKVPALFYKRIRSQHCLRFGGTHIVKKRMVILGMILTRANSKQCDGSRRVILWRTKVGGMHRHK